MSARNLVLIGFMGTGKSTVGRLCAARLGFAFRDSDRVIEARAGMPIRQLFAEQGEAAFRRWEREVIAELSGTPPLVIATGGGAALDPENVQNLRAGGLVIHLTASPSAIARRVGDARSRPLLAEASDPQARITQMLAERSPHYARAAHHQVETSGRPPKAIAEEIVALFRSGSL